MTSRNDPPPAIEAPTVPLPSSDRQPLFLLTDDAYTPTGFVVREVDRLAGYDTTGRPLFNRKNQAGMESAAKKAGHRLVTSNWYGVKAYPDPAAIARADSPASAARLVKQDEMAAQT